MSGQAQDLVYVKTPGAVTFCGSCLGGALFAPRNAFAVFFEPEECHISAQVYHPAH